MDECIDCPVLEMQNGYCRYVHKPSGCPADGERGFPKAGVNYTLDSMPAEEED